MKKGIEVKMDKNKIKEKAEYCLNCKTKPCQTGCPLENDIPEFIQALKNEEYEEAYNILCKTTVLQPICGRICPHKSQCEGSCTRRYKGEAVSIGDLEAYIGDMAIKKGFSIYKFTNEKKNKKIAVVGGGPAGISVAAMLARNGYKVVIYEKYNKLGGILRHGIPDFRLPEEVLDKTIEKILELGINVEYNKELGKDYKIEDLQKKYDAVYLSFGANISSKMGVEGENLEGVYGGNELLEYKNHPNYINKKVAIIGGGNVAMDVARTVKKMGAKEVNVIYRRAEEQMPSEKKEVEEAKQEGVQFLFQNNIVKIIGNNENKVKQVECIKTKLIEKEGENRLVPVNIEGSNYILDIDYIIMALGAKAEKEIVEELGVELTTKGYIKVDENYMTSKQGIFAGGDLAGIRATVAWASRSGRKAAEAIIKYLNK